MELTYRDAVAPRDERGEVMNCCGYDGAWRTVVTKCPDPENPGERLTFTVCPECDYGINEHTEDECDCRAPGAQ